MSFNDFEVLLLIIAVLAWGVTDALLSSGMLRSQTSRRAVGCAASLLLIFVCCLNLTNVIPEFALVATQYLMIHPDAQAQGKIFAGADFGLAFLTGVAGTIGLLFSLSYKKPD